MFPILRGRVFSIYFWALQGVAPFGSILIGWTAQNWGVQTAAIFAGTTCLLGIVLIRFALGRQEIIGLTSDKRRETGAAACVMISGLENEA